MCRDADRILVDADARGEEARHDIHGLAAIGHGDIRIGCGGDDQSPAGQTRDCRDSGAMRDHGIGALQYGDDVVARLQHRLRTPPERARRRLRDIGHGPGESESGQVNGDPFACAAGVEDAAGGFEAPGCFAIGRDAIKPGCGGQGPVAAQVELRIRAEPADPVIGLARSRNQQGDDRQAKLARQRAQRRRGGRIITDQYARRVAGEVIIGEGMDDGEPLRIGRGAGLRGITGGLAETESVTGHAGLRAALMHVMRASLSQYS